MMKVSSAIIILLSILAIFGMTKSVPEVRFSFSDITDAVVDAAVAVETAVVDAVVTVETVAVEAAVDVETAVADAVDAVM